MSLELEKKVESLKAEVISLAKQIYVSRETHHSSVDIDWSDIESTLYFIEEDCTDYLVAKYFMNNEYGSPSIIALSDDNKENDLYIFDDIAIHSTLSLLEEDKLIDCLHDSEDIHIYKSIDVANFNDFLIVGESLFNTYKMYKEANYQLELLANGEDDDFDSYCYLTSHNILELKQIETDAIYGFKNNISNPELDYYQLKDKLKQEAESAGIRDLEKLLQKYVIISALKKSSILGRYQIYDSPANKDNDKYLLSEGELYGALRHLVSNDILIDNKILYCDRIYLHFYELKDVNYRFTLEEKNYIEQYKKCLFMGIDLGIIVRDEDDDYSILQSSIETDKKVLEYYKKTGSTSYNPYSTSYNNNISQASKVLSTPLHVPNQVVGATCPTCGKASVRKITTGKKATSFAFFGLFSSNLGKTMECSSCGYKW